MNHANIPNDLLKMMIINLGTQGKMLPDVAAGWAEQDVVTAINENTDVKFDDLGKSTGISLVTMAPYYDGIYWVELDFDIRSIICEEINTFGVIDKNAEVSHNKEGIFINDHLLSAAAYHTYDACNERGYFYAAVTGLYFDKENKPHELNFYMAKAIEEGSDLEEKVENAEGLADESWNFLPLFSCIPNSYRQM